MGGRKVEHVFGLDVVRNYLVRVSAPCTDAEAMRVQDAVRGEFPGVIEGMYGWEPDDYENDALDAPGVYAALAVTCEEGETLPEQVRALRRALPGRAIDVRAFDMAATAWQFGFPADQALPDADEWSTIRWGSP